MVKCYYRAGKDRKGKIEPCTTVVQNDPFRQKFLDRLQSDEDFRTNKLRWTKHSIEEYIADYKKKADCPGPNIKDPSVTMCSHLYLVGDLLHRDENDAHFIDENGEQNSLPNALVCPWDESHDCPTEDIVDDVCLVTAFSEGALLKTMKRRLIEKLDIYTYVGDIVLCLNPYMYLPEMVDIAEYPNQKIYKIGKGPSSYASAHFAYWNSRDKLQKKRNQSCIVSGESGAGKTVACSFIMKYLAKLSNWRKMERGKPVGQGSDITSLVAGVSPFLEAFGNAKTNMNDNSSRFGKFTKIWFADGEIIGAELEHYLLEKARIADQGSGERNYHIFYFLLRGGKSDGHNEVEEFKLKNCDDYPKLIQGGSSLIGHGLGEEYDTNRMNAPLADDPDDTGVRAALRAANVSDELCHELWESVAGCLKLLSIEFEAEGEGSKVKDPIFAQEVAELLGLQDNFGDMLVIYRLYLPGGTHTDKPCDPLHAADNRNALAKDIYDRLFAWLIMTVCNDVLTPKTEKEVFVGLLDIFGFELMPKNSIEQLCINFANEKLQQLFNHHVFDDEAETYKKEGLDDSMIPPHRDNTPCCNLMVKKTKKFMGIFPMLDDFSQNNQATDVKFIDHCSKVFGKSKGVNTKAKDKLTKTASEYYYGDKKKDFLFHVVHFAGDVVYNAKEFIAKNKDKLAPQLDDLLKGSSAPFLSGIYNESVKGKKFKTLASKYTNQLHMLATTLEKTNPHYVRCVKPNDIHYRPVDGYGAFNDWKTYRQLLYAGVMEVCKIKKEGYPFREEYSTFWQHRVVEMGYHVMLNLNPEMDPKEGVEQMAKTMLPGPEDVFNKATGETITKYFWALGETLFFGKDNSLDMMHAWYQDKLATVIQKWSKYWTLPRPILSFARASFILSDTWRMILSKRKYASCESHVSRAQAIIESIKAHSRLTYLRNRKKQTLKIQKNWSNYNAYHTFYVAYKAIVRSKVQNELKVLTDYYIGIVRQKLAASIIGTKVVFKLQNLRMIIRVQMHLRKYFATKKLADLLRRLALEKTAGIKAAALWQQRIYSERYKKVVKAARVINAFARMINNRKIFEDRRKKMKKVSTFIRGSIVLVRSMQERNAILQIQRTWKWKRLLSWCLEKKMAVRKISRWWSHRLTEMRLESWFHTMCEYALQGDLEKCEKLTHFEEPFTRLRSYPLAFLMNMRGRLRSNGFMHKAAQSMQLDVVKWFAKCGAPVDICDHIGETPLHYAVVLGDENLGVVQFLIKASKHHQILEVLNNDGDGPFDKIAIAGNENSSKTLAFLSALGAKPSREATERLRVQREKEALEDALAEQALQRVSKAEEEDRNHDFGYQMLVLNSEEGQNIVDPVVFRQNMKRAIDAIIVLQAWVRGTLTRMIIREVNEASQKLRRKYKCGSSEELSTYISQWRRVITSDGTMTYFYNPITGESSWESPANLIKVPKHPQKDLLDNIEKSDLLVQSNVSPEMSGKLKNELNQFKALQQMKEQLREKLYRIKAGLDPIELSRDKERQTITDVKQALTTALHVYQHNSTVLEKQRGWYYEDAAGIIHGPYPGKTMRWWFSKGEFHVEQPVRWGCKGSFSQIQEIFSEKDLENAFCFKPKEVLECAYEKMISL
eukprot:g4262.t1